MTFLFSAALLVGALCTFALVLRKIRHSEMTIADSLFWFFFAASLVILALFRDIAFFFADVFGVESPANFVFVYVIAILVIRELYTTVEVSQLRAKLRNLVQEEALSSVEPGKTDCAEIAADPEGEALKK